MGMSPDQSEFKGEPDGRLRLAALSRRISQSRQAFMRLTIDADKLRVRVLEKTEIIGRTPPHFLDDLGPRLPRRIPSLDGLRAISIGLVLMAHVAGMPDFPRIGHYLHHLGNLGVKFFFVISGFLISTLLFKEQVAAGKINLKNFYLRRTFRILPAFYCYFLVIFLANRLGAVFLEPGDALHAATFTMNYHHERAWALNHMWSLSVEEQFYLLWPPLIWVLGPRRATYLGLATLVLSPATRAYMILGRDAHNSALTREFQAVADALATGCVLAAAYNWLGRKNRYLAFLQTPGFLLVPLVGFFLPLGLFALDPRMYYLVGQSVVHLAIALCIDRSVRHPEDAFGVVLNSRGMVFIGVLSYSLYLWQEPFLNPFTSSSTILTLFPINIVLTFLCALASYYLVELPFLRLRSQFRNGEASTPGSDRSLASHESTP
jgi:peptidoglycan/LPS O-acetylase OafA/YrhL